MPASAPHPQQVLLPLLGDHAIDQGLCIATASVIDVLGSTGIGEHAVRAALSRMARRGLLQRVPRGREVYVGTTESGAELIVAGRARTLDDDVVTLGWDGNWTTVLFTMPDRWQRQRSDLRRRLQWAGFGPLQKGVWITPSSVDAQDLLGDLEAAPHLRLLRARVEGPTSNADLVAEAYDIRVLASRYSAFERRWRRGGPRNLRDALARRLVLTAEWLQAIRDDPRLPVELLPPDWPGLAAQRLFRAQWIELDPAAREVAATVLDTIPTPGAAPAP